MPPHLDSELKAPLLRIKISVPHLPEKLVHRHRLTHQISEGVKGPLTVISAPAGFGKTHLLIEWAAEAKLPIAWLTIEDEDNDPSRFVSYLMGALQNVERGLGEDALDFLQSTKGRGLQTGLTLLINEISALPQDLILVLDEFQVLEDESILQSLNFILKHLPRNLHLIISSRTEPALDLAVLRAKGKVIELGADELRFTNEETASFFNVVTDLQLSPETVAILEENTDGWITGIQMAAISLRHSSEANILQANLKGDIHHIYDFLADEVLNRQPEEIRQFLLQSSVLDKFCGPMCEAVIKPGSQPGYGAVMLQRLEHANLFIIAIDEKREWYRYHHLFADFLRHMLTKTNAEAIPLIQKRAALWHEQNMDLYEALKYAIAAGDAQWTADLIERNVEAMIAAGELSSLMHWIGKLPDQILHQHPSISLAYAWGLIAAHQLDTASYWLNDVEQYLSRNKIAGEDQDRAEFWNIYGGLAVCKSVLALSSGNMEEAAQFSREAAEHLGERNPFQNSMLLFRDSSYFVLSGDTSRAIESLRKTLLIAQHANNMLVLILATCQLAEMQAMEGQLSHALVTLRKAQLIVTNPDGSTHPLAGIVDIGFGEILLIRDVLDQAREYLERGCKVAKRLWTLSSFDGLVALARVLQIQGDYPSAQTVIEEASQMALSTDSSEWDETLVSAFAARIALQHKDLANAIQWWKRGGFPDLMEKITLENYPYHVYEYVQLTQVRLLLAMGRESVNQHHLQWALELLEPLGQTAERFKRITSQIEILLLQSLVKTELGGTSQAVKILLEALTLGEPED